MADTTTLTIRTSRQTAAEIDSLAASYGWTRSMFAAMLLYLALNSDDVHARLAALNRK